MMNDVAGVATAATLITLPRTLCLTMFQVLLACSFVYSNFQLVVTSNLWDLPPFRLRLHSIRRILEGVVKSVLLGVTFGGLAAAGLVLKEKNSTTTVTPQQKLQLQF